MDEIGEPSLVSSLRLRRGEVAGASAAGGRLATGGGDGALRLWVWGAGRAWEQCAEAPRAHRYGVTAVQFAPSGQLLATAGVDGAARVWRAVDARAACGAGWRAALVALRTLAAPDAAAARALQWVGGERAVVGHDDGGVRVWAPRSGALLAHVRAHEGAVHAVATLASGALLLTACTDGVLKVFEFDEIISHAKEGDTGPSPILWEDGAHDLGALCAVACARDAATGGHDGRVRLWRVEGAGGARRVAAGAALLGHSAAVTALSWRRGVLASASLDRTARLWSPATASCLRVLHAHERYLTCVELAHDLRFMITASNDKSIRTWSLGNFFISDDIELNCNPLVHFGLGDLEGIGPVSEMDSDMENLEGLLCTSTETHRLARVSHVAAINSVAISKKHIATACSDGYVRVFKWLRQEEIVLELELELAAHSYPVLSVDFGADGALLLSGGLDGCARLWDVQSGCELVVFSAESVNACGGEGGGGVRDTRLSTHRPPLLLIACDDGHAAIWGIDPPSPDPLHVYTGLAEAAMCCAWSADGRALVTGGEAGELHLLLPPHCPGTLHQEADAHDLGVLSCDFAPNFEVEDSDENIKTYLLATGGRDTLVKLWWVELEGVTDTSVERGSLKLAKSLQAHGGVVQCVRWGPAEAGAGAGVGVELWLATGGVDRWARVWRVRARAGGEVCARALAALPVAAGGAPAVRLLPAPVPVLAVGELSGTLTLWRLPNSHLLDEEEGADVRAWGPVGVAKWLREYVTRPPGSSVSDVEESRLLEAIRETALGGPQLLDKSIEDLMTIFGYGENESESSSEDECGEVRARLLDELLWLRRDDLPSDMERGASHALRCPLTHAVLREPARAADGFTYERGNILHWLLAAGGEELRSPMSGLRLSSALVEPNHGVRDQLRRHCGWRQ